MKKILSTLLAAVMMLSLSSQAMAETQTLSEDIVILYTNDVHTYIDKDMSYDVVSAIKKDLQKQYKYVLLADAGDHIQGTAYGSMDKGENIIKMMNEAKYDVATLGNHEFDYGMEGCLNTVKSANFPYVSANFYHEKNGEREGNVLDSFVMFDCGGEKIAFVGITTPETFEKSAPTYFQDENGSFIYGISGGENGTNLRNDVQNAIDEAKASGATCVVALGHLGIDPSSRPYTSEETISNVSGLDAFIDGHSHSTVECETIKDKDGNDVVLTQTGNYFDRIGMMVIDAETDKITTDFIECEKVLAEDGETVTGKRLISDLYNGKEIISDAAVKGIKDSWIEEIDGKLGEKIGCSEVSLDNFDADGNRLVRVQETNTGDFAADALYYLFDNMDMDVDAAIMNGGGIRNTAITGDISYKTCKDIHTFGNIACMQTVTGRQILDALEWGAGQVGIMENGGFLQVSGITYKVDTDVPNTVKADEKGTWLASPDKYRVHDVKVYNKATDEYEALDLNAKYNLAGYNYTLRNLGDGYAMFDGAVNVLDYVAEDYMVLANYVEGFENGNVKAQNSPLKEKYPNMLLDYREVGGSGRIEVVNSPDENGFDVISVGGVWVTEENKNDVLGDGGSVKYDPMTSILTLTDAEITNENGHAIYAYGLYLTVNGIDTDAEGENNISSIGGCGIYAEGDGYGENGSVVLTGNLGNISAKGGDGISAYNDIIVEGKVGKIECTGDLNSGILSSFGRVLIENNAELDDILSESYDGINAASDIVIYGRMQDIAGGGYAGIRSVGGDIYIGGEVLNIIGEQAGIEAYKAEEEIGGSIAISGSIDVISGSSTGIYAERYLNISGIAEVCVADTDDAYAVSSGYEIILPDEFEIVAKPTPYEIKEYETEDVSVRYTIVDSDGTFAHNVKFEGFANLFEDVNTWDWYYTDVAHVTANKLMSGISKTEFAPNNSLTRAMLVTVLYRAEGEPNVNKSIPFADVKADSYYADAVIWAQQNGIVSGINENEFAPDENITREQIAAIIYRYAEYKDIAPEGAWAIRLDYADMADISDYAVNGVMYCTMNGIMYGKDNNMLAPKDGATRAEIAAVLQRFMKISK